MTGINPNAHKTLGGITMLMPGPRSCPVESEPLGMGPGNWLFFFLAALYSMCDLSSPVGIEPEFPAVEAQSLNDWTTGEAQEFAFLKLSR